MNILLLTATDSGCWKWRGKIPAKYLRRRGHTVQVFDRKTKQYDRPDVVVFFRTDFVEADEILAWAKAERIRIVFDTDDALDVIPISNPAANVVGRFIGEYHKLAEAADVITTTTPTLAAHLRARNPNVVVLPNSVDPEEWQSQAPNNQVKRIGWTGGSTHFNDLGMIAEAVRIAQKRKPFTFVMQGLCSERTPLDCYEGNKRAFGKPFVESQFGKSMKWFLDKLRGISGEFCPSVPVDQHADRIQSLRLDVGLAPLVEGRFNSYKSSIKFYEYAMAGAATIASRVLPYSAEVPNLVRNTTAAWADALTTAAGMDHTAAARVEREWVMEHRNMERNIALWEAAYQPELSRQPVEELELATTGR